MYIAKEQHVRELNALHAATVALLNTIELSPLMDLVPTVLMRAVPAAQRALLLLSTESPHQMQIGATRGFADPRLHPGCLLPLTGYFAKAARERMPLVSTAPTLRTGSNGARRLSSGKDIAELRQVRASLIAPLLLEDRVLGLVSLHSLRRQAFTEADLRLASAFAATASVAIRNAQTHAEVEHQAITDHLTGLYNRRGFFELGQRELERARRYDHSLGTILFDIDHFKQVNDTYGHAVGDHTIRQVAERCRKNVRHIDIAGRYGGEEFAVLVPETDMATLYHIAERLRECTADEPFETEAGPIRITISIGVTMASSLTMDLGSLLNRADAAMYAAKQMGGNHLVVR